MRRLIKKSVASLALVGVLSTSLVGCSKAPTVESLFTKSSTVYEDAKSVSMTMDMDMDGSMSFLDESMDVTMNADLDIKSEDKGSYCEGTVKMNMFGISQEVPVKAYSQIDEDKLIQYTYDSESESWSKSEMENTLDADALSKLDYSSLYSKLTLDEKTDTFNDTEVYHVSGDITGSDFEGILSQLGDDFKLDELEDLDMSSFVVGTDFYFSKKDARLLGVKMDFAKTDFSKLSGGIADDDTVKGEKKVVTSSAVTSGSAVEEEETNSGLSFKEFQFVITFTGMDDYTFEIPNDVIESATDVDAEVESISE